MKQENVKRALNQTLEMVENIASYYKKLCGNQHREIIALRAQRRALLSLVRSLSKRQVAN